MQANCLCSKCLKLDFISYHTLIQKRGAISNQMPAVFSFYESIK